MGVDLASIPMRSRRAIEAEMLARVYRSTAARYGEESALSVLSAAIDEAAFESGRAFAASSTDGMPSLDHFAQVLELWKSGGALDITDIQCDAQALSFRVTRCGYMELYREMELPVELHATLSCRRDAAFARGYSSCLTMQRPQTISQGADCCLFLFRWIP